MSHIRNVNKFSGMPRRTFVPHYMNYFFCHLACNWPGLFFYILIFFLFLNLKLPICIFFVFVIQFNIKIFGNNIWFKH